MKILIILTSHESLGDTGEKTGFWLEELAAPYYVLTDAGAEVTLASPKGGLPPLDPKSADVSAKTDDTRRFEADDEAQKLLANTHRLADMKIDDFDAIFFPGGHGPLWDLAENATARGLIEKAIAAGKPVAAVCHAPAVFRHAKGADGASLVKGKKVTGFTNSEEEAVGLTKVVPFLVEDMLGENGGIYSKTDDWGVHVLRDGLLITGQNPASSGPAAEELVKALR